MAVHEWLQMKHNCYCNKMFKLAPKWGKCIDWFQNYAEKQWHSSAIYEQHLLL